MSVCIAIASNQLEMVAEKIDNKKFKYKFLYDSDDKYKTIQQYDLQLLNDCLMFTGLSTQLRANRMKINGRESDLAWNDILSLVFREDRHVAVVNDYWDNNSMVLVIPTTFYDSITHGRKEFKSEAEAIARGDKIVDNELNYVLDYNETHPDNPIQPSINYYRIYPSAIDENGQYWYYLHFFTTNGEGQDDILKSKF